LSLHDSGAVREEEGKEPVEEEPRHERERERGGGVKATTEDEERWKRDAAR